MRALILAALLCTSAPCLAQGWWHDIRDDCTAPSSTQKAIACIADFFTDTPAHLKIGSLVPGTSLGGGVNLFQDLNHAGHEINFSGQGVYTTTNAWGISGLFLFQPTKHGCLGDFCPPEGDRFNVQIYGSLSVMRPLNYFGEGSTTPNIGYTYELRESVGGIQASVPFANWGHFVTSVENRNPEILPSSDPLSVEENFNESGAPGLAKRPTFMLYSNSVQVHHPKEPPYGQAATVGYVSYRDLDDAHYSFGQFFVNGQLVCESEPITSKGGKPVTSNRGWCKNGVIRLCDCGRITLRANLETAQVSSGHVIPFYYLPTLGGSDINNIVTLRGYPNYRFSGPDRVFYQFDYDYMLAHSSRLGSSPGKPTTIRQVGEALWGALGVLTFYDAGTVGFRVDDLGASNLRQDAGIGLELRAANSVFFQGYLAWGAGNGTRVGYQLVKFF